MLLAENKGIFMNQNPVYVSLEFTPNPNTLKYSVNREILKKGALNLPSKESAKGKSPLADQLFEIPGIDGVMIGKDFVTLTKSETGDWDVVHKGASTLIETFFQDPNNQAVTDLTLSETEESKDLTEIEKKICDILDQEIRPAVAMDGGDITFEKYENGIVYLYLQGSCAGCPSATMTLKMGVEERLKKEIPEIKEVVQV